MDLAALGVLDQDLDPIVVSERVVTRYTQLWSELTGVQRVGQGERWRIDEHIRRLNTLGFDVDELSMSTDPDTTSIQIQPSPARTAGGSRARGRA